MQTPSFKISIPQPCTQSWGKMTPSGGGRHCASCDKVVTDFSRMSDQQVQDFFALHYGESVCGRFRKVQLDRIRIQVPSYILHKPIPVWKKFLVIILICFGSSIFSFDVAFGNSFNTNMEYIQSEVRKMRPAKSKKKKKRKKPRYETVMIMVAGNVWGPPTEAIIPPDYSSLLIRKPGDPTIAALAASAMKGKKTPPEKKNPFSKAEFILPAALARRKRKK